ncbi:MAG: amidohydrolase family protein [Rectinemataceae bacterium]
MREYDLVIKGGRLVDPANGIDAVMDLAVEGGKIAAVSKEGLAGRRVVDARSRAVSPGFVDVHSHVDGILGGGICNARMGVTTVVAGNCGMTSTPEGGAIGLSFGIEYSPGTSKREFEALANVARERDLICPVHIRCGGPYVPLMKSGAPDAIREVLDVARSTKARFHISHIGGQIGIRVKPREALLEEGLRLIEEARAEGLDIESDMHPYDAGGTNIGAAILDVFEKGFPFPQIIKNAVFLDVGMIEVGAGPRAGKRLTRSLMKQIRKEDPLTLVVLHFFDFGLVERVLEKPWVSFISDGDFDFKTGAASHPRCSGTYPRFIQLLVRETGKMSLSEAIARMTCKPADRFRLAGKGRLSVGSDADIVVFDPATIADNASYAEPDLAPSGIDRVFVNGIAVLENGSMTDRRPGRAIRF